jgi:hypothetical protein
VLPSCAGAELGAAVVEKVIVGGKVGTGRKAQMPGEPTISKRQKKRIIIR